MSISITLHLKHAQWRREMAESFMLMRSSSGWGEREEGLGVFEADKNGNVPLAAQHPCIKASCRSLGSNERGRRGRKEEERIGVRGGEAGGEMSQLCLTGLRAELCGLMLGEGGCPPQIHTRTHTDTHTHRRSGGVGGGGGEENEERLGDSLVTVSWVTCQQALTWSSLTWRYLCVIKRPLEQQCGPDWLRKPCYFVFELTGRQRREHAC